MVEDTYLGRPGAKKLIQEHLYVVCRSCLQSYDLRVGEHCMEPRESATRESVGRAVQDTRDGGAMLHTGHSQPGKKFGIIFENACNTYRTHAHTMGMFVEM